MSKRNKERDRERWEKSFLTSSSSATWASSCCCKLTTCCIIIIYNVYGAFTICKFFFTLLLSYSSRLNPCEKDKTRCLLFRKKKSFVLLGNRLYSYSYVRIYNIEQNVTFWPLYSEQNYGIGRIFSLNIYIFPSLQTLRLPFSGCVLYIIQLSSWPVAAAAAAGIRYKCERKNLSHHILLHIIIEHQSFQIRCFLQPAQEQHIVTFYVFRYR